MRRLLLAPVVAAVLLLAACSAPFSDGTPEEGSVITIEGTFRPELSWPDLDAERYLVGIVTESGTGWMWEGADNSVIVSGVPEVDWLGPGFAIEGAAELWFAAFDVDGKLVYSEQLELGG